MIATKAQERKTLEKIMKMVEELGEDSYIGAAFEGCFEVAESNIRDDAMCSLRQRVDIAEQSLATLAKVSEDVNKKLQRELDAAKAEVKYLEERLEREQEWTDKEVESKMSQEDYERLAEVQDEEFTEEQAAELVSDWFGFKPEMIEIKSSIPVFQVSRHSVLRKVGELDRKPAYVSTDWNYVRFNARGFMYEMVNGQLAFYYD